MVCRTGVSKMDQVALLGAMNSKGAEGVHEQ